MKIKVALFSLIFIITTFDSFAQTIISGKDISGIWTNSNGPYIIQGSSEVGRDKTLVIQPGVEVRFETDASLRIGVDATIIAEGTAEEPIRFTSANENPEAGDWRNILNWSTEDRCSFKFCIVEYSSNGIVVQAVGSGCNSRTNSTSIESCTFTHNENAAITVVASGSSSGCTFPSRGFANPTIHGNTIHDNPGSGILVESNSGFLSRGIAAPLLSKNILYGNGGDAIRFKGVAWAVAQVLNNTIVGNEGSGLSFENPMDSNFLIVNNIISENTLGIFSLTDSMPSILHNNVWQNAIDYQSIEAPETDLSLDPQFRDAPINDYRLNCLSPCIDAGHPTQERDPDGSIADLGALPFDQTYLISFSVDSSEVLPGTVVNFSADIQAGDYQVTNWLWDFGDGNTQDSPDANHEYEKKGKYNVSLTVGDSSCNFTRTETRPELVKVLNSAPEVLIPPSNIFLDEDQVDSTLAVTGIFSDPDADELTISVERSDNINAALDNETILISPAEDWFGMEEIRITATDTEGASVAVAVEVTVNPINDGPQLNARSPLDSTLAIVRDSTVSFTIEVVDIDSEPTLSWFVDDEQQIDSLSSFSFQFLELGEFVVKSIVADGEFSIETLWSVTVTESPSTSASQFGNLDYKLTVGPNPFLDQTTIDLKWNSNTPFSLHVTDVNGKLIRTLKNHSQYVGRYLTTWDRIDQQGGIVPAGMYFLVIHTERGMMAKKMVVNGKN